MGHKKRAVSGVSHSEKRKTNRQQTALRHRAKNQHGKNLTILPAIRRASLVKKRDGYRGCPGHGFATITERGENSRGSASDSSMLARR
jgi:hypothetical protein